MKRNAYSVVLKDTTPTILHLSVEGRTHINAEWKGIYPVGLFSLRIHGRKSRSTESLVRYSLTRSPRSRKIVSKAPDPVHLVPVHEWNRISKVFCTSYFTIRN